ncbi:DinB family protein [Dyadobacter subterraneus]|uniref:DinB family protein n=1 Tax=Dyadobacter subterraneus TaxID=2773304 RepID=A0ABR9WCX0_9BACT|nr:DinB family protein [Dyadobacter subterraneus]MBE9462999.1 DinB family protein [Dyadobacter subterraneus]
METVIQASERLRYLLQTIPDLLDKIPKTEFSFKASPTQWSKKEILGHLIDSATNNHQRFIRIQFENEPIIFYDQNEWCQHNNYQNLSTSHIIQFWKIYNQHLLEIIKIISADNLQRFGAGKDGQKLPLHFYITDYVDHLEHHLKQLVTY